MSSDCPNCGLTYSEEPGQKPIGMCPKCWFERQTAKHMCPNCGQLFPTTALVLGRLIPRHDFPTPFEFCPGSDQNPRNPETDHRPLWKDLMTIDEALADPAGFVEGMQEVEVTVHRCGQPTVRTCRVCGCTDEDCSGCIERTGSPCHWVEEDLCSACVPITMAIN